MAYENQNPLDEDIHERTLENIIARLVNKRDVEKITSLFNDGLLPLRKKADYDSEQCTQEECANCRAWCESLRRLLDERFRSKVA